MRGIGLNKIFTFSLAVILITTLIIPSQSLFSVNSSHDAYADNVTATIPVSPSPYYVAINPITNTIYVNSPTNVVSVINGLTNTVTTTISVGNNPNHMAVYLATNTLYVTNENDNTVSVINGQTNAVTATIPVGTAPAGVSVNQNTDMIYVANINSGTVSVINGQTNTVTATIPVFRATGLDVNPLTNTIYVGSDSTHTVTVINGQTNTVTATITAGYGPDGIAVNQNTNTIYAANNNDNTVTVINGQTNAVTTTIPVGKFPLGLSVNLNTNEVYVPNFQDNTVSVINGQTNTVTATIPVGSGPQAVAINRNTNTGYVPNYFSNSVSVISISATPTYELQSGDANQNCEQIGGTWGGSTCTLNTSFTLQNSNSLTIDSGVTLAISGGAFLDNYGTISNVGTLSVGGVITHEFPTAKFTNSGTISIVNGGQIDLRGIPSSNLDLSSLGTTYGSIKTFSIYGGLTIPQGNTLTIPSGYALNIVNGGNLHNYGTVSNAGTISDDGFITHEFPTAEFSNTGAFTIVNNGFVDLRGIPSSNLDLSSLSTMYGSIKNFQVFYSLNIPQGITLTIPSGYTLSITNAGNSGTFTNAGTIDVYGTLSNALGNINNNNTINVYCGGVLTGNPISGTSPIIISCITSTTTTLSSSSNPAIYGQPITFTAKVSPSTATGTVTFTIDGTPQPPIPVSSGTATLDTSSLSVGSHTISATYSGDTKNAESTSGTLTVTVQDVTPPVLTLPSPITASATGPSGAVVTFTVTATDPDDTAGPVQCNPSSGSTFPIGTTTVTCTSTDTHSNTGTASFTVTISTFLQEKQGIIPSLQSITPTNHDDKQHLKQAIEAIQDSVDSKLWQSDGIHLVVKTGDKVFDDEKQAVQQLKNIIDDKKEPSSIVTTLQNDISTLTDVDQKLANTVISDANTAISGLTGDHAKDAQNDITQAQKEMTQASDETLKGHYEAAIDHYKNAWKHAEDAVKDTSQH